MFDGIRLSRQKALFEIERYKRATDMMEALPSFAKDEDENEWQSLSTGKRVYSEVDIVAMQEQAMDIYYKNPIASGIIETLVNFVVGKSMKMVALDEDPKVQAYWDKFYRVNDFDEKSKELVRRTFRDGESFTRFFEPKEKDDVQRIRFVEPSEIKDLTGTHSYGIETDSDDVEKIVNYHRVYPKSLAGVIGDAARTPETEIIPAEEIVHKKIKVDSNVKRGVSFFVGISNYLTKYKSWLDDRILLNKIRTIFHLVIKPTGISSSSFASQFPEVTGKTASGGTPRKQMPKAGSVLIAKGVDYEMKNLNIRAPDTKDDGRAILLMIVTGTNLAEYMVTGDASNANYSSTMVSESPAVKAFEAWQDVFEKVFKKIFRKVVDYGIKSGELSETSKKTITSFDKEKAEEVSKEEPIDTCRDCQVDFPLLIHREIKDETEALQIQRSNGWISDRTATGRLGYNYREEQEQLEKEAILSGKNAEEERSAERIRNEE